MRRLTPLHPVIINIHSRFAPERLRVGGFIKDIYRRSYGADISVIYTHFGEGNYAPTENDIRFLLELDSKTEATIAKCCNQLRSVTRNLAWLRVGG